MSLHHEEPTTSGINLRFNLSEQKYSRWRLVARYCLWALVALNVLVGIALGLLHWYGAKLSTQAQEFLNQSSPDYIVVYTGDFGRVIRALELVRSNPNAKVLISGVASHNNLQQVLATYRQQLGKDVSLDFLSQVVELDYQAQNTFDNVLMTLDFLKKNRATGKVVLISSEYHLLRTHFLVASLLPVASQPLTFYYLGVETPEATPWWKSLKTSIYELLKLSRALLLVALWESPSAP